MQTPTETDADGDKAATASQGNAVYTEGFRFYGDPESGARVTKGWFKVVPDSYLSYDDYDDDEDNWYYSDKDGKLVASEIKTINSKKYAFDEYGAMQDGLKAVSFVGTSTTDIDEIKGNDKIKDGYFDTEDNFKENVSDLYKDGWRLYYFGDSSDGAMKTGKQNITIDGDTFAFLFNKSGSTKGQGKLGVDDKKFYLGGMLMKADKDDKYSVVKAEIDADGKYSSVTLLTTEEFLADAGVTATTNTDKLDSGDYEEYYDVDTHETTSTGARTVYKLVNTSGSVQKGKNKAKDGDDRCYKVEGEKITAVYVED